MKHYDEKTKTITLVTGVNGQELETKEYLYPIFVKGIFTKKAIDLGAELEENEFIVHSDLFDRLTTFITELYGKQFTTKELTEGIDAGNIVEIYVAILMGTLQGDGKNE
ncbi:hypothetical protein GCM10011409_38040 [Lentibacillus populi]|uniref:Phage protein n=1 Tax=Lentibacillus populi TaxID=1827502 RepID=A0A9W5U1U8_9BACI|nr:hypothetical protein [Lentibacillus populi]GGB56866.1 hypothetical protein GCM10011409_38040 [Lentibacillus populi]